MATVTPPMVIDGDGDLRVYSTVREACSSLESYDVDAGLYEAFDSAGHPLRLYSVGLIVGIELPADSTPDPDELARRLRAHISDIGADRVGIADLTRASIPTMLAALHAFEIEWRAAARKRSRLFSWLRYRIG